MRIGSQCFPEEKLLRKGHMRNFSVPVMNTEIDYQTESYHSDCPWQALGKFLEMRYLFDQSDELSDFCRNLINGEKQKRGHLTLQTSRLGNQFRIIESERLYK